MKSNSASISQKYSLSEAVSKSIAIKYAGACHGLGHSQTSVHKIPVKSGIYQCKTNL